LFIFFIVEIFTFFVCKYVRVSFKVTHWALATLCISIVSWLLTSALGIEQVKPWRRPPRKGPDDAIDV
jgi:hypothetical protein